MTLPRRARVRAPELVGRGGWLNTGGRELTLASLRGSFVLLDFWTFCCVNCLHVLDELRPLEETFADVLVVVGVHSPKFAHEGEHAAVVAAVERYDVTHPVLDDPDLATWSQYAVRAWPTLALVDPEGYVVAQLSGEGHAHALEALLTELVPQYEQAGLLRRGSGPYEPPPAVPRTLRFPSKAVLTPGGTLLVADSGHHRLVELAADAETVLRVIGEGERGGVDGAPAVARFSEPNGLCVLPPEVAAVVGYDVVVADTVNHLLRGVRLADGEVSTVAGTGRQWMQGDPVGGDPLRVPLSSPWDVTWLPTPPGAMTTPPGPITPLPAAPASPASALPNSALPGSLAVAMAGTHTLWSVDPGSGSTDHLEGGGTPLSGQLIRVADGPGGLSGPVQEVGSRLLAGTTQEGLVDGEAARAWLAQPSGLAVDGHDGTLWFVDAETSALRRLSHDVVHTAVGRGLFDFGHVDGPAAHALLQHPLGLCVLPDGSIAVADTYNGAVRRFDPTTREVSTLATGLAEPTDVLLVPDDDRGQVLLVVESAAHRLVRLPLDAEVLRVDAGAHRTPRPPLEVAAGPVALEVVFTPPPGQKLDDRYGPSTHLVVSASPPGILRDGSGAGPDLHRALLLADDVGEGVLHVSVRAASCDDPDAPDAAEFPACHVHQQDWGVPLSITAGGASRITLVLAGMPDS